MKKFSLIVFLMLFSTTFYAQQFVTGLEFSQKKYEDVTETVPLITRSVTSVPRSYSIKAYAPTPGNQGRQPSCVGWASGYGARTIANAVRNGWRNNTSKINQNTFSPSFVYNLIKFKGDNNCKRGSYIADAMRLMNKFGILALKDFSYSQTDCVKNPSSYGLQKAKNNTILTYERLAKWDNPYNLVGKVKKAIANKNPVVIGMQVSSTFYKAKGAWSGVHNTKPGGHAMVVVGYDDDKYGGAFELLNSWGTNWGNSGYIWVRYADFKKNTKTAYVLIDKSVKPTVIVSPDDNNDDVVVTNNSSTLAGEMTLKLSNGNNMRPILAKGATRNFNIVKASGTTYRIADSYASGTQFRIYLKSKQKGYVYLIGYGSADKSVNKLYPFDKFSDYFSYTNSEIALPNEDYFIEFDNKPGRDILCVLYSKEKLDINKIVNSAKYGSGDFVSRVKKALQYKMFKGSDIRFDSNKIAFATKSSNSNAKVVPIFIEMNHQ
ncbi:MAG: C1 family peptidase [Flavobacteriaceae bacterium]|mgnify:CR=1 FL=1